MRRHHALNGYMIWIKGTSKRFFGRFRLGLITCGRGTGPSQARLGSRPELLQSAQVSRTVRAVKSAKIADYATITTDAISPNLQLTRCSGDRVKRCAVLIRLAASQ